MDEPVAVIPAPAPQREGSTMRGFLAQRGVIIMREHRPFGSVLTYGAPLDVSSQIFVRVKGKHREVSTGVRLEQAETNTKLGSVAFIDSDEIGELVGAIGFIISSAEQMALDNRDYTEVTYSTRDEATVGFYQTGREQQAFARLGATSSSMFFPVSKIDEIRRAVLEANQHSVARRADWEAR